MKGLSKVKVKNIHFSSLVLRAHLLFTGSNQVDIARFHLGKSNLAVPSHLRVLHAHGNGFLGDFLQQFPRQEAKLTSQYPLAFVEMGETITFFPSLQGALSCHSLSKMIESGLRMKLTNSHSTMQNASQRIRSIITFSK